MVWPLLLLGLLAACRTAQDKAASTSGTAEPTPPPETATALPPPTPPIRRLEPGELVIAADKDAIPAIMAQSHFFADAASEEWLDEEYVIGLSLNGEARAYPIRLLSSHELVNDTVGGEAVLISWCPLCFSAVVFERTVDGRELTFGVSGMLYRDNLIMYDHQTNTLWSQLLGQSLRGALRQQRLTVVPSVLTTWGEWKALYPETLVLSAELLGQYEGEVIDPYSGYYTSGAAGLGGEVTHPADIPAKTLVVGVQVGEALRAYPLPALREAGVVEDELGGVPLLLVYDANLQAVFVYSRELDGAALTPYQATLTFWFAWAGIFPETQVYTPSF